MIFFLLFFRCLSFVLLAFKLLRPPIDAAMRPLLLELSCSSLVSTSSSLTVTSQTLPSHSTPLHRFARHRLYEPKLMQVINSFLGKISAVFGPEGSGDAQFKWPVAVSFDEKRNEIVVAECSPNNRIQVFDLNGNLLRIIGKGKGTGPDIIQFYSPSGIHVNSEKSLLLVADTRNHRVLVLRTTDGSLVRSIGSKGEGGRGKFQHPRGVAMHLVSHRIFVCDSWNNCVQVFSENGAFLFQFGSYGKAAGQLYRPCHVSIDSDAEEVYVTDLENHRVSVFSTSGEYRRQFGSEGSGDGQFKNPRGIVVHPLAKELIVADTDNHRLQVFDREGRFLRSFGSNGSGDKQFHLPYGLCAHGVSGHIAVADLVNYRVHILPWG